MPIGSREAGDDSEGFVNLSKNAGKFIALSDHRLDGEIWLGVTAVHS